MCLKPSLLHWSPCRDVTEEIRMESKLMKPGEDALLIDNGWTNKWRWLWIEEIEKDGQPFGSCCKKLRAAACSWTLCSRKLVSATSGGKKPRHESDPDHRAAVRALQHTTRLPGATTTADVPASMTDRVWETRKHRKIPNNGRSVYLFQSLNRPGGNLGQAFNSFLSIIRDENVTNFSSFSVNSPASFWAIVVFCRWSCCGGGNDSANQHSSSLLSLTVAV